MVKGCVSYVKALRDFMGNERVVTIPEFKALTEQDKADFREMLIAEGYDVAPLIEVAQAV